MANVAVGDVYRVLAYCTLFNQLSINRYDIKITSLVGATTAQQLIDKISTDLGAVYTPLLTGQASYYGAGLVYEYPTHLPTTVVTTSGTAGGGAGTQPLPTQTCGIFTKISGNIGRANRGRCYVPFPDASDLHATNGLPITGYQTRVFTLSGEMTGPQSKVTAGGTVNYDTGIWVPATNTFTAMIGSIARKLWATQRRRGDYGRPNIPPF